MGPGCILITLLFMDTEIRIAFNFHVIKYYFAFEFFQLFKNIKNILTLSAKHEHVVGQICQSLN